MEKPEFSKMANTVKTNIGGFCGKGKKWYIRRSNFSKRNSGRDS